MPNDTPDAGPPPKREPTTVRLIDLAAIGMGVALCVVGGMAIGYGLDAVAHTSPWLTFAGLAFGIVSAVLYTVAKVRQYL